MCEKQGVPGWGNETKHTSPTVWLVPILCQRLYQEPLYLFAHLTLRQIPLLPLVTESGQTLSMGREGPQVKWPASSRAGTKAPVCVPEPVSGVPRASLSICSGG